MLLFASSAKAQALSVVEGTVEPSEGGEVRAVRIAPHTLAFPLLIDWLEQIFRNGHRGVRMGLDDGWLNMLLTVFGITAKQEVIENETHVGEKAYETHGGGRLTLCWDATGCTVFYVPLVPPRFPKAEESPEEFAFRILPIIEATKIRLPNGTLSVPGWKRAA